jgi:hypothetical protein
MKRYRNGFLTDPSTSACLVRKAPKCLWQGLQSWGSKIAVQQWDRVLILSIVCILLVTQPTLAFKPDEDGHLGITGEALKVPIEVQGETLRFSDRAKSQIRTANKFVDLSRTAHNIPIFSVLIETIASLPGFNMAPEEPLSYS